MPGVFENTNIPNQNISADTPSGQDEEPTNPNNQNRDINQEPIGVEEETPVRELTQTDKINRFMLKSFLEHMNNQLSNQQFIDAEAEADAIDGDSQENSGW